MAEEKLKAAVIERWRKHLPDDERTDRFTQFTVSCEDMRALVNAGTYFRPTDACMEWQPIETAPKDGTPLLLVSPDGHLGVGFIFAEVYDGLDLTSDPAAWTGQKEYERKPSVWLGRFGAAEATHWMPLPAPPILSATAE